MDNQKIICRRKRFTTMKNLLLFLLISALSLTSAGQNPWELGAEYMRPMGRGYKSNIVGLRYENFNNKTSFSIGITYHFSPRDAYGGFKGYGMYAGFRNSFGDNTSKKSNRQNPDKAQPKQPEIGHADGGYCAGDGRAGT